jgi:riboflavin synthase
MFTGLIREIAKVKSFSGSELSIKSSYKPSLGDSIAINGACLSVTKLLNDGFTVELSPESQKVLCVQNYKNEVHVEPAMKMGDRFEGHIVQGHVDCIGEVTAVKNLGNSYDVFIKVDKKYIAYYKKGSKVNIETDMFARYVAHIISHQKSSKNSLSWDEVDTINAAY